jgi:hypothetical protein
LLLGSKRLTLTQSNIIFTTCQPRGMSKNKRVVMIVTCTIVVIAALLFYFGPRERYTLGLSVNPPQAGPVPPPKQLLFPQRKSPALFITKFAIMKVPSLRSTQSGFSAQALTSTRLSQRSCTDEWTMGAIIGCAPFCYILHLVRKVKLGVLTSFLTQMVQ